MKALVEQWRSELAVADRPDEYETKRLLARLGLHVPRGIRLQAGAPEVMPDFPGPYAAKVCTPEILHKTDLKGVLLNLEAGDLPEVFRSLYLFVTIQNVDSPLVDWRNLTHYKKES